jgi:hypothetical protein
MEFECSSEKERCDKWIARMKSCRECLFNVLCRFNSFYQKKNDNRQNKKDTMWDFHEGNGVYKTRK